MTLLKPGGTVRYILPDGSVYTVTVARDPRPDEDDGNATTTDPPKT